MWLPHAVTGRSGRARGGAGLFHARSFPELPVAVSNAAQEVIKEKPAVHLAADPVGQERAGLGPIEQRLPKSAHRYAIKGQRPGKMTGQQSGYVAVLVFEISPTGTEQ